MYSWMHMTVFNLHLVMAQQRPRSGVVAIIQIAVRLASSIKLCTYHRSWTTHRVPSRCIQHRRKIRPRPQTRPLFRHQSSQQRDFPAEPKLGSGLASYSASSCRSLQAFSQDTWRKDIGSVWEIRKMYTWSWVMRISMAPTDFSTSIRRVCTLPMNSMVQEHMRLVGDNTWFMSLLTREGRKIDIKVRWVGRRNELCKRQNRNHAIDTEDYSYDFQLSLVTNLIPLLFFFLLTHTFLISVHALLPWSYLTYTHSSRPDPSHQAHTYTY